MQATTIMGITLHFVVTDSGTYLYEQKRPLTAKVWATLVYKSMLSAGFSHEEISDRWHDVVSKGNYYNRHFYRPVRSIVQEQIELSS